MRKSVNMHLIKRKLTSQLVYDKLTGFFLSRLFAFTLQTLLNKISIEFQTFFPSRPKWHLFIYNHHKNHKNRIITGAIVEGLLPNDVK